MPHEIIRGWTAIGTEHFRRHSDGVREVFDEVTGMAQAFTPRSKVVPFETSGPYTLAEMVAAYSGPWLLYATAETIVRLYHKKGVATK